ncbi:hypothetical protein Tco_1345282 [Tanacetum coccineum]
MECSSCGALYNKSCGCSKGGLVDKFVRDPNKMPDSSQRPPIVCVKCGNPVEGPSCQGCALWRKKLKEVWFTTCHENGINQDLLNTSESSDDDTNVVNAPREPFVVKQDPGENSTQSPPQINHNCCYECGDSLDGIFCQQCTYTSINDSQKIDSNLDEFAGELTLPHSIPPGIDDINLDPEGDTLFLENTIILPSCPKFESFHVIIPFGRFTIVWWKTSPWDVPNILPTHPTLQLDFDFIPSHNDLGSDLVISPPSGDRNKIYDPRICIEVESTKFLSTLSPVIDTLLPFSSKNKDKVFNHGVFASKEKSPPYPSYRGFKASKLFHQKSPMLIHGDNTPDLGVRHPYFYPP